MNLSNIMRFVRIGTKNVSSAIVRNAPEILTATGIAGVVVGAGVTVVATVKTVRDCDDMSEELESVERTRQIAIDYKDDNLYPEETYKSNKKEIYLRYGAKVAWHYVPSLVAFGVGIGSFIWSKNILSKRNAALAASYAAVSTAFEEYRKRVVEKYGKEEDQRLRYGTHTEEYVDEETGEVLTKEVLNDSDDKYTIIFDERSELFLTKDQTISWREHNMLTLKRLESYMQREINSSIYGVSPNELCDQLGIQRRAEFVDVVWPKGYTIDFGLSDVNNGSYRDVVNGYASYYAIEITGLVPASTYANAYARGNEE